jgi:hypothetical protein
LKCLLTFDFRVCVPTFARRYHSENRSQSSQSSHLKVKEVSWQPVSVCSACVHCVVYSLLNFDPVFGPSPAEQALRALIESTPPTITGPSEPEAGTEESAGRTYWRPNIPLLPEHKLPLPFETVEWEKDIVWDADTSNVVVDSNGIVTRRRNPYVCRVVMEKDGEEDEVEVQPAIPRAGTAASAPQSSSSIPNADYQRQAAGTAASSAPTRAVKPKWKRAVVSGSEILLEPLERENRQVKLHKIDFSAPPGGQPAPSEPAPAVLSYPLCCPLNSELTSGRWLLDVVWDAADPRYKGFSAPLVLDRNDPGVIFRDELPESSVAVLANEISGGRADVSSSTSYDSLVGRFCCGDVADGVLSAPLFEFGHHLFSSKNLCRLGS